MISKDFFDKGYCIIDDFLDEEIAEFFETHRGLNKSQHLHEAPYWNESQSAFLKDSILEDAAWAEVIDQLNAELHE